MDNELKALKVLRDGGIVIFPTDTAFGIGCRIDSRQSIDRLFSIRKRPLSQATPVLVDSQDMALGYFLEPDQTVKSFMSAYWPGALTIVSDCRIDKVYEPVRGGGSAVGLRMPDHPVLLRIISRLGVPVLGPSANFHGESTPYALPDVNPDLIDLVDYVLPGECKLNAVSTVVDCTVTPYRILRQGAVRLEEHNTNKAGTI